MIPCGTTDRDANEKVYISVDSADFDSVLQEIYTVLGCSDVSARHLPELSFQMQGGTAKTCPIMLFKKASHLDDLITECRTAAGRKGKTVPTVPTANIIVDVEVCAHSLYLRFVLTPVSGWRSCASVT